MGGELNHQMINVFQCSSRGDVGKFTYRLLLLAGIAFTVGPRSSQQQDPTPSADSMRMEHEFANVVLSLRDRHFVGGSIQTTPTLPVDLDRVAKSGKNPIFYDDTRHATWVTLLNEGGHAVWRRSHQGPQDATASAAAALPDGFILAGEHRRDERREFQGWLLRLDSQGAEVWRQILGRPGVTGLAAVVAHEDGTIIAGGAQDWKGWLVAVDGAGRLRWERSLDDLQKVSAIMLHGRGVVLAGIIGSSTKGLGFSRLIALDEDGQRLWSTAIPTEGQGQIAAITALPAGGGVAVGDRQGQDGDGRRSAWVVRFGSNGAILSSVILPSPLVEVGRAVVALTDGGYAVAGESWDGVAGDRRIRLWRMAADDTLRWQRTYGTLGYHNASGIAQTRDGGLLVVGAKQVPEIRKMRALVVRTDPEGDEVCPSHSVATGGECK